MGKAWLSPGSIPDAGRFEMSSLDRGKILSQTVPKAQLFHGTVNFIGELSLSYSDLRQTWSRELKDAYKECFEVDLDSICGKGRLQPPVVPVYRPWVRLFEITEVEVGNFRKFTWKGAI